MKTILRIFKNEETYEIFVEVFKKNYHKFKILTRKILKVLKIVPSWAEVLNFLLNKKFPNFLLIIDFKINGKINKILCPLKLYEFDIA